MIHKSWDLTIETTHQKMDYPWSPPATNNSEGFTIEGNLVKIRNHNLQDPNTRRFRYMAITLDVTKARKREFRNGSEIDTQFQEEVLERKGYLNVYDHVKQKDPHAVPVSVVRSTLKGSPSSQGDQLELWATTQLVKAADFQKGEKLCLKTLGNNSLIESITSLSSEKHGNYYGEDVLNRWDTKIQDYKTNDQHEGEPQTSSNATDVPVDDDEWD